MSVITGERHKAYARNVGCENLLTVGYGARYAGRHIIAVKRDTTLKPTQGSFVKSAAKRPSMLTVGNALAAVKHIYLICNSTTLMGAVGSMS